MRESLPENKACLVPVCAGFLEERPAQTAWSVACVNTVPWERQKAGAELRLTGICTKCGASTVCLHAYGKRRQMMWGNVCVHEGLR